jgi:hypothetical protein
MCLISSDLAIHINRREVSSNMIKLSTYLHSRTALLSLGLEGVDFIAVEVSFTTDLRQQKFCSFSICLKPTASLPFSAI